MPSHSPKLAPSPWRHLRRAAIGSAWAYLIVIVAAWIALREGGDRWWCATVLLFAPRWIWAPPLAVLAPMALWWRGLRLPTALAAIWVAWPLMGLCMHWPSASRSHESSEAIAGARTIIRVLTCNVGLDGYDEQALAQLVRESGADVVTLQEGFQPPVAGKQWPADWNFAVGNGIMLASRFPIASQQALVRETEYGLRTVGIAYRLETPEGPFEFVALHLYTPRDGLMSTPYYPWEGNEELEINTAWRAQESADASRWVGGLPGPVIVAGDMNLPPESEIFRRDWSGYADAFSAAGWGYGYTYGYDVSGRWYGIRIDHVLAGAGWQVERCWVGSHIGSDHRPVVADVKRVADERGGVDGKH